MTYNRSTSAVTITLDDTGMSYPVTIDPTLNLAVGAGANDGHRGTTFNNSSITMVVGSFSGQ